GACLCQAAGRCDLAADPRFTTSTLLVQNRSDLVPLVEAILKTRTTPVWQDLLRSAEVPHAPVWNYDELFAHPQTAARGFRVTVRDARGNPVDLIGSPFHISGIPSREPTSPPE